MEESTDAAVEGVLGAMENLPIKTAGWNVDLGPDGGEYSGRVVACGPPEQIVRSRKSYTAGGSGSTGCGEDPLADRPYRAGTGRPGKSQRKHAVGNPPTGPLWALPPLPRFAASHGHWATVRRPGRAHHGQSSARRHLLLSVALRCQPERIHGWAFPVNVARAPT